MRRSSSRRPAALAGLALVALALATGVRAAEPAAVPPKAQLCVACHGAGGNSTDASVPSLAGQPKQALVTQLYQFREGNRKNPIMSPLAAGMSNADMNELGAWFSAQPVTPPDAPPPDAARLAEAKTVLDKYRCASCHGADLAGQQHIPRLAGQKDAYLRSQLAQFKAATRADLDGLMTAVAQPMTTAEIEQVSAYLSTLRP